MEKALNTNLLNELFENKINIKRSAKNIKSITNISRNEITGLDRKNKNQTDLTCYILESAFSGVSDARVFNINEIGKIYQIFVNQLLESANKLSGKKIIFNNDVHIYNNDSSIDIGDFHKFLVFRNPLDQLSTQLTIYFNDDIIGHKRLIFITRFIIRYNLNFFSTIRAIINDKSVNLINYELFLKKKSLRDNILEKISCLGSEKIKSTFNLEYSKSNIRV